MLKSDENKIVVNDFVQGEPLSEENLDKTLDIVTEFNKRYRTTQDIVSNKDNNHNMLNENHHEIRLSLPEKTIWLYSGYRFEECLIKPKICEENIFRALRYEVIRQCDVMVDGKYIDSQRNISKKWAGSDNQRVISVQESIKQNKVILYCD